LLVAAAAGIAPLAAQAPGLPVAHVAMARGLTLAGRVGFPNQAAGAGTAYEIAATLGARRFAITALASLHRNPGYVVDDYPAFGGRASYKIFGGPLVPFGLTLQAGAAYAAPDPLPLPVGGGLEYGGSLAIWRVPVGLGLAWTIARPIVAIRPWIAPRIDVRHVRTPAAVGGAGQPVPGSSVTETEFGLSGGVSLGFLNGVSVDVAGDRIFGGLAAKPATFSVGLSVGVR
jgi:hypothetical protein